MSNKNTIVVNLFGGSCIGKSTLMAKIFAELKTKGYDCEMATEFIKDMMWENNNKAIQDDIYTFANQNYKIKRLIGEVDIVITDSPILLKVAYSNDINLQKLVISEFKKYNNLNFLLKRETKFIENGRVDGLNHAIHIDKSIKEIMINNNIEYDIVSIDNLDYITSQIIKLIKEK